MSSTPHRPSYTHAFLRTGLGKDAIKIATGRLLEQLAQGRKPDAPRRRYADQLIAAHVANLQGYACEHADPRSIAGQWATRASKILREELEAQGWRPGK